MNAAAKVRRSGALGRLRSLRRVPLTSCIAQAVMEELSDIVLAYGQSDEFSFVLRKHTGLYERRARRVSFHMHASATRLTRRSVPNAAS